MEMRNLRENILAYRNTKDKAVLEDLYIYFTSYIKNIGKKIFSNEYKEIDLKIKFIEVINKLNLKQVDCQPFLIQKLFGLFRFIFYWCHVI